MCGGVILLSESNFDIIYYKHTHPIFGSAILVCGILLSPAGVREYPNIYSVDFH